MSSPPVVGAQISCIIFLDVDGVLNRLHVPEESMMLDDEVIIDPSHPAHPSLFKPCVNCLKDLIHALEPDAKVVVSSSWRLDARLMTFLVKFVDLLCQEPLLESRVIGTTRCTVTGSRSSDITDWIDSNIEEKGGLVWLVIDDNDMNLKHIDQAHKVLTAGSVGLTQSDVLVAIDKVDKQRERQQAT